MSKKKKLELDDYDFDDGLDMPDFNMDAPPIKDDRNPATKLATGAIKGFKDSTTSPAVIRRMVKDALPRGYGQGIDLADQTAGTLRNLYNTTAKELKPVLNDMKRTTARILPSVEGILPGKMAAAVKRWSSDTGGKSGPSAEDLREAGLQSQLGEIFKMTEEQNIKRDGEQMAQTRLQEGMDQSRHRENFGQFDSMRNSLVQLVNYQTVVGSSFQRKSLELQYRQYFVAQDSFEEQKKQNLLVTTNLEAITKNTGLPEYAKLQTKERLAEVLRNKFIDGVNDSVFAKRRQFINNLGARAAKGIKEKVQHWGGQFQQGLGMADSMAEMRKMNEEMGVQNESGSEMAGGILGGMAGDHVTKRLGGALRRKANEHAGAVRLGNQVGNFVDTLPQKAQHFVNNTDNMPIEGNWFKRMALSAGKWLSDNGGRDAVNGVMSKQDSSMQEDKLGDMQNPDIFGRRTNKSITEVIPGLLARILRESTMARTGSDDVKLVQYDFMSNKFSDPKAIAAKVKESFVGAAETSRTQSSLDEMIDELDKDKTLTAEQRTILGRQLLKDNMNNKDGNSERMTDQFEWKGESGRHGDKFANLFKEYFKDDKSFEKQRVFSQQFSRLGEGISDARKQMQDHVNVGNREALEEMGLLKPGSSNIDMERLYDYYYNSGVSTNKDGNNPPGNIPHLPNPPTPPQNGPGGKNKKKKKTPPHIPYNPNKIPNPNNPNGPQPGPAPAPSPEPSPAPTPQEPQRNITQTNVEVKLDSSEIIKAIKENAPKTALETVSETLLRIEKKINEGIDLRGGPGGPGEGGSGGPGGSGGGRWWNRSIGDLAGGGMRRAKRAVEWGTDKSWLAAKWGKKQADWGWGKGKDLVGKGWDKGKEFSEWSKKKLAEADVYIKGELGPRLEEAKMKAGEYYDEASGKVIKSYKDIKGAVLDAKGKTVLKLDEWKKAYIKEGMREKFLNAMMALPSKAKDQVMKGVDRLKKYAPAAFLKAENLLKMGMGLLDQPQDIYVKGKTDPVMLKVTMKAGGYISRIKNKPVMRPSEIDGVVLDDKGDVVLTAEQFASGLLDKQGRPIKSGISKLISTAKNISSWGTSKVVQAFKYGKDKASKLLGGMKEGMFSGWFNINIQTAEKQSNILTEIRDILDARLPNKGKKKIVGDSDGNGVRDNSYEDMMSRKKKEKEEKEKAKAPDSTPAKSKSLQAMIADKAKSLFDKLRGKKSKGEDGEEEDDEGGLDLDGEGRGNDSEKRRREKRKRRMARRRGLNRRPPATGKFARTRNAGRMLGRGAMAVGRGAGSLITGGGGMLGRGAMAAGRVGLAAAGLGLGGLGTIASGVGSLAMGAGGMALSAGGAILGGLGTAAAAVGSVLTAPVILGALAAAAVGYGAYKAYKYFTRTKLTPLSTVRYAQYGFLSSDTDHLQQVFGLEDIVMEGVTFDKGVPKADPKKVDMKKAIESFGIDVEDGAKVATWTEWFGGRFKPVFFNHLAALYAVDPAKKLADIDDLKPDEKKKYFTAAKFPEGPYGVTTSPFEDLKKLVVGASEVKTAIELAETALASELKDVKGKDALTAAAVVGGAAVVAAKVGEDGKPLKTEAGPDALGAEKLDAAAVATVAAAVLPAANVGEDSRGTISMTSTDVTGDIFTAGRVDALEAVRYRTYGLGELILDKVRSLSQVEALVIKDVIFGKGGQATWSGKPDKILRSVGAGFGIEGVNNNAATDWLNWFSVRFLPTYLNYVTSACRIAGKTDITAARRSLTPQQMLDVAMVIYTTNNSAGGSVWSVSTSPWPNYELNINVKSVDANIQGLKDDVKQTILDEEQAKEGSTGLKKQEGSAAGGKPGFWASVFGAKEKDANGNDVAGQGNWAQRVMGAGKDIAKGAVMAVGGAGAAFANFGTNAGQAVAGAFGFGGGSEFKHPGKGTGGDINSIPKPTGNKTYASMKATIDAAAAMVGVDPKLMATMAAIESGFDSNVKAGTSSATGLYQFLTKDVPGKPPSTWTEMLNKYGAKYGIAPGTPATDPRANALMGAEFIKQNANRIKGSVTRNLTDTDLYLAHFLGSGGANKILKADPNALAASVMPAAAASNHNLFYGPGNTPLTVAQFYEKMNTLVRTKGKKFGLDTASEKMVSAPTPSAGGDVGLKATATAAAPGTVSAVANGLATGDAPPPPALPAANFPVNDQAPTAGPMQSSEAPMQVVNVTAKRLPKEPAKTAVDEAVASASSGFMSSRSRDNIAQQQFQKDLIAPALDGIGTTLGLSLEIHRKTFEAVDAMLKLMQAKGGTGSSATAAPPPMPTMPKQQREAPKAVVSMSKMG